MKDNDKPTSKPPVTDASKPCDQHDCDHHDHATGDGKAGSSRRKFLKTSATGLAAGTIIGTGLAGNAFAGIGDGRGHGLLKKLFELKKEHGKHWPPPKHGKGKGRRHRTLLKGGVVLSMDPSIGDFEKADVLIEGSKIVAVRPNIRASAEVIDCRGMIVMPGLVDTHHHQYETIQRNIIPDGSLGGVPLGGGDWPQENYTNIVQSVWTTGRIGPADNPVWDLGRSPYDPDDCYISELLASVSQINQGVTLGIDTSQSSHSPEHTDALIQGLVDSGRRTLYAYGSGRNDTPGYEYPGTIGDTSSGLGRLRVAFDSGAWSNQDLVTLGHTGGAREGWELARAFDAVVVNHNNSNGQNLIDNQDLLAEFQAEGRHIEQIHCARFQDEAYDVCAEYGVHISIATITEQQMGHGMPPFQACLDRGILPSLSADVDTNNTPDLFSIMRQSFGQQRALLHQRSLPVDLRGDGETDLPLLVTAGQVLEMGTRSGAVAAGLGDKVGRLAPGMEADIILLKARSLSTWPINNAPGSIVTMMDTSHVDSVFIAGELKKWQGKLIGVNEDKLLNEIENARERVLARINGPAVGSNPNAIHETLNGESFPYRPALVRSCCASDVIGEYNASPGTGG